MADDDRDVPRERSRSAPIAETLHALLGSFPVAFFTLAFVTDIVYSRTAYLQWQYFSIWLITAGLIMGGLAVLAGLIEWLVGRRHARARGLGLHSIVTVVALLLGLLNAFVHSRDGWTAVVPEGLILSGVVALLLLVAAWLPALLAPREDRP